MKNAAAMLAWIALVPWMGAACAAGPTAGPAPAEPVEPAGRTDHWAGSDHRVEGVIVDAEGQPLRGKVAIVSAGGSTSSSVSAGTFEVGTHAGFPKTLCAWTEDGLFTSKILRSSADAEAYQELTLFERGAFLELYAGGTDQRVTVVAAGTPLHDVSFPAGIVRTFVVPATEVSFGPYRGDTAVEDRALRTAWLAPGEKRTVTFE
ncbi:MAG: hypothetical protein AAGB93_00820 [Planctomycetota bacterium]